MLNAFDDTAAGQQTEVVTLRPFGLLARMRRTLLVGGLGAVLIMVRSKPQGWRPILITLGVYMALMLSIGLAQAARRRGRSTSLRFDGEALFLPFSAGSSRGRAVPYHDLRAANLHGSGWLASFVLDDGDRAFTYPLRRFAAPDGPARIKALLQARIMTLPDGAGRWARIERLGTEAERLRLRRPWVTWSLAAAIILVFALQLAWPHLRTMPGGDDGLAAIDLGANAASLVTRGQAWRLVTASLMHASPQHLLSNLVSLLVIGSLLEQLVGSRRFLLAALLTAIVSEAASTAVAPYLGDPVYSLGISGAVFGLIGMLGIITWRLGAQLPAGFRLPRRAWISLLGLNLLITALVPQVDKGAHVGGLLAGAALGWLMIVRAPLLAALQSRSRVGDLALICVAAVWLVSLAGTVRHAGDPAARLQDRVMLMQAELANGHATAVTENLLAYAVAEQPGAGDAAWSDARRLARRAIRHALQQPAGYRLVPAIEDTVAVLDDRLGDTVGALRQELPLLDLGRSDMLLHMKEFLERAEVRGTLEIDGIAELPSLSLAGGMLHLQLPQRLPQGGEMFGLLRLHGVALGILDLRLPPGSSGAIGMHTPRPVGTATGATPNNIWLDPDSRIELALFDASRCRCDPSHVAGHFYPLKLP